MVLRPGHEMPHLYRSTDARALTLGLRPSRNCILRLDHKANGWYQREEEALQRVHRVAGQQQRGPEPRHTVSTSRWETDHGPTRGPSTARDTTNS